MIRSKARKAGMAARGQGLSLSAEQRIFNALSRQLADQRVLLAAWPVAIVPYQQRYTREFLPRRDAFLDVKTQMARLLDRSMSKKGLSKADHHTLAAQIVELAGDLGLARNDEEMKALYGKHSGSEFDRDEVAARILARDDLFDVDFDVDDIDEDDDEDPDITDDFIELGLAQYEAQQRARAGSQAEWNQSARQLMDETREAEERTPLPRPIHELYRTLTDALNPESEIDVPERGRKAELSARVEAAYADNNLLGLLDLQLQLERIDPSGSASADAKHPKHCNLILKSQLDALAAELIEVELDFVDQFDLSPFEDYSPDTLQDSLDSDIADIEQGIAELENQLQAFKDVKQLKAWLRDVRRQEAEPDDPDQWSY